MHDHRNRRFRFLPTPAAALFLLLLAPSAASAQGWSFDWRPGWVPGDPVDESMSDPWAVRGVSGLFVAIDPTTHRPTQPSAEQRASFQRALDLDALLAPSAPVRVEALPHGGQIAHLNGAFQSFSIARRDASGRFVNDCAPDAGTARRLLEAPLSSTVKEER